MKLEKVWPNQRQIFPLWSLGLRDWDYSNWFHSRRSQLVVARQEKGGKSWYFWSGFLSNANSVIRGWRRVSVQMFACTPTSCVCADATLNPAHASVWRKRYILGFAGLNVGQVRVHNNKNKQGYNQWQDTGGHQCSSSFQHKLPAGLLGKPDDSGYSGYWHTTTAGLRGGSLEHFVTKNSSLLNVMKYLFVWGNSDLWQNVSNVRGRKKIPYRLNKPTTGFWS